MLFRREETLFELFGSWDLSSVTAEIWSPNWWLLREESSMWGKPVPFVFKSESKKRHKLFILLWTRPYTIVSIVQWTYVVSLMFNIKFVLMIDVLASRHSKHPTDVQSRKSPMIRKAADTGIRGKVRLNVLCLAWTFQGRENFELVSQDAISTFYLRATSWNTFSCGQFDRFESLESNE